MSLKSSFKSDLEKEQELAVLLDKHYTKYLKTYSFERINDIKRQMLGIDVIFTQKKTGVSFFIDEKAQLDYINDSLPTFAFELQYQKANVLKRGWLFDENKKTAFYSLVTSIYSDELNKFTSCKITFVNRAKLVGLLSSKGINESTLNNYIKSNIGHNGKFVMAELNSKKEGYLYFSTSNKLEKPINLILRLDFLIDIMVGKRLC